MRRCVPTPANVGRLAVAGLLVLALIPAAPATHAAEADPELVFCVGTQSQKWDPGLLLEQQLVTMTLDATYQPCLSTTSTVTSGTMHFVSIRDRSCLDALTSRTGTMVFVWNDKTTSTFPYTGTVQYVAGQVVATQTGTISAGRFTGASVVQQITSPSLDITKCLAPPGITNHTGVLQLLITSL